MGTRHRACAGDLVGSELLAHAANRAPALGEGYRGRSQSARLGAGVTGRGARITATDYCTVVHCIALQLCGKFGLLGESLLVAEQNRC